MPRKIGNTKYWRISEIETGYNEAIKLLQDAKKEQGRKKTILIIRATKILIDLRHEWLRRTGAHIKRGNKRNRRVSVLHEARSLKTAIWSQDRYTIDEECSDAIGDSAG